MAQYQINDPEGAVALLSKLDQNKDDYISFVQDIKKVAEDGLALERTASLNTQVYNIFTEVAKSLEPMIPGYEQAVQNLRNIVNAAEAMEEAANQNALGSVM